LLFGHPAPGSSSLVIYAIGEACCGVYSDLIPCPTILNSLEVAYL